MQYLLGIDIGTQGTKAALFTESGKCLAQSFRPSKLYRPAPGVVEEDPEFQFSTVCQSIRACVRKARIDAKSIAGIGIDGQMAGTIGVGKDGRNVTPYDSWLDTRCAPYIKLMEKKAGDEVVAKAGCPPSFNHGPKKLWWMHERKKEYKAITAFVQPGGYAAMRLCGLDGTQAFIDTSYLHFSGFADNQNCRWNDALCEVFDFNPAKLPKIVRPETVVGEVLPSVAKICGLRPGVPVVAGLGDTAASFLACGATAEGISVDVAGTALVFATTTATFSPDRKHRMLGCGHSATPGLWHPYAYINGGGMNLEWFRKELANQGKAKGGLTFDRLNALAAKVDPKEGLPMFVPHLGGRVCPSRPDLRGAWAALDWSQSLGHLYRAVLEGVALEYAVYKKVLLELYPDFKLKELRITGGGEKSNLWNSIKADALQTPVRKVSRPEGAPLGAALLAGYGVGVFRSLPAAAEKWIGLGDRLRPKKAMAQHYSRRQAKYEALTEALDKWAKG